MKISLEWLGQFVTWTESDPTVIAERLTRSTAEVEELEVQGALLAHCCVGEIVSLAQHPDADRLKVVEVKTDKGTKNVVCGGTNLYEGMLIAFAHVGATVKHGKETVKLEPIKIRGQQSEGMVCAAEELELDSVLPPKPEDGERAVMDLSRLNKKMKAGDNLRDLLGLNDTVFHFSNTAITARPDLFSHIGFARECVALGLAKWKKQEVWKAPKAPAKGKSLPMKVDCADLVPRYLSASLTMEGLGETPEWMKKRLSSVGIRSISLPVDITNYVMIEVGVPMHSFDADDIEGVVHMRLSTKKESLMTLDGKKWDLPEGCLVLSDDKGVFDLVGIMGGLRSSTKDSTKNIFLHALSIDPVTIRKAIIGTGLRTDASTVYEKGVPGITTEQGFYRALELMLELIPGAKLASEIDEKGHNGKAAQISISGDEVRASLGLQISDKEIVKIWEDLGCEVKTESGKRKATSKKADRDPLSAIRFSVTPPLYRLRDITGAHDLIEEAGRIHGFDKVEPVMPSAPMQMPKRDMRLHKLREDLARSGYWELMPLSFVSPQLLERCALDPKDAIKVKNPIGEETSLLHTSPLPQLLAHAEHMLPRAEGSLSTFQCANVFDAKGNQTFALGMLLSAKEETDLLNDPFLMVKSQILDAITATGQSVEIHEMKKAPDIAHPGRCASIMFRGKSIGEIYEVHPSVRTRFGLSHRSAAATLDLSTLLSSPSPVPMQKKLSSFPAVTYDVTVKRTQKEALGPLLRKLRSGSELLETVSVQDLYAGKPLEKGSYNLTLRFVYRAKDRTLTETEVKTTHEGVLKLMKD